jgi:phosphotransferase system enzyme I (PtsI)
MLAQEMSPYPVSVRTLDTGSDITLADSSAVVPELNAGMGLRGIRLSLVERKMFREQIEAVIRASNFGRMEIVLPMVTSVDEVREAKDLIEQVRLRMLPEMDSSAAAVPIGVMIEVPAAVLALESIAQEVDFLCVGTNDLIQYVLAVDRGNPQVSHLFQPLNPSVLQCLKRIADVCRAMKMPVRVCGEMSSNPFFVVLLIGLGFTDLSMNAFSIPTVRRVVQEVSLEKAEEITAGALRFSSTRDISAYLVDAVTAVVGMDLSAYVKEVRTLNGYESMTSEK